MKKVIRKILKEDRRQMFLDKIIHVMKNDFPLFHNLKDYGFYDQLSEDELNYVLSGIFGKPVTINKIIGYHIYDENDKLKKNLIYYENSNDIWVKKEYDENGRIIYYEDSNGKWWKKEYHENGNMIYHEYSDGFWKKWEFDKNGNVIYYENSDGLIRDYR